MQFNYVYIDIQVEMEDSTMDITPKGIGKRIRTIRKERGLNQKEFGDLIGKSLRTVQMYESGDSELSISLINLISDKLGTTSTYLIGYDSDNTNIQNLSNVMEFLFKLENILDLKFSIDVKKPPTDKDWECSITFSGKNPSAEYNGDMCLFLEQYSEYQEEFNNYLISKSKYSEWKDKTIAYYSNCKLDTKEPEELDETVRLKKRNELINKRFKTDDI